LKVDAVRRNSTTPELAERSKSGSAYCNDGATCFVHLRETERITLAQSGICCGENGFDTRALAPVQWRNDNWKIEKEAAPRQD
jgi:hypothetical protein